MGTILIVMARIRAISRMPAIIHCAAFAMIGVAFGALFLDRSALGLLQRDPTLTGRTELWDAIFRIPDQSDYRRRIRKLLDWLADRSALEYILVAADAGAQRLY